MNLKAMSFKRVAAVFVAVISLSLIGFALTNPSSGFLRRLHLPKSFSGNSITGLPGGDGALLVVKIDDTRQAHPQIGLENADIVYIEQVEGGLTRLAAVFSSSIPSRIGPVRSARISDIELLQQFGRVGFAYSGAQKLMRPVIASANLEDLGAQSHSPTIYTTDSTRTPPYAMVLRADLLMQFVSDRGLKLAQSKNMGWNFGDAPEGGAAIKSAHVSWPSNSYDVHWSNSENRWLLDHSYQPNLSESGFRLGPKTFVIQLVSITDSIYKDKVGGVTPFSATIGEGRGYILRDGRSFEARWSRPDATSGTSWKLTNGKEITFPQGQIWVALTDKEPIFTTKGADAGMKSSK
jgi:hypothetical protein